MRRSILLLNYFCIVCVLQCDCANYLIKIKTTFICIIKTTHKHQTQSTNGCIINIRFGVERRHWGPPFALGYHQFIILVAIQDEGEGEGGTPAGSVISMYLSGLKKTMVGKSMVLTGKETRARLGKIEVRGGENSKWMGQQM